VNLGVAEPWRDQTNLGFTAQGRLQVPIGRRFFLALTLEYRLVCQAAVGPYTTEGGLGDPVTLQATDVTYTHRFVGIGSGIRF
jgi:hypothetical protein